MISLNEPLAPLPIADSTFHFTLVSCAATLPRIFKKDPFQDSELEGVLHVEKKGISTSLLDSINTVLSAWTMFATLYLVSQPEPDAQVSSSSVFQLWSS